MKEGRESQTKICPRCEEEKPRSDFNKCISTKDGLQTACRVCQKRYRETTKDQRAKYGRRYRLEHPEVSRRASKKYREANLEKCRAAAREHARRKRREFPEEVHRQDRRRALAKNYGITVADYDALFEKQNGVCAICGKQDKRSSKKYNYLCVDHDHKTNRVRGLLCANCNVALGQIDDNLTTLRAMIVYLESWQECT